MGKMTRRGLEYTMVNQGEGVEVYKVRIAGAESGDGEKERWGGNVGYRAISSFDRPLYRAGVKAPAGHVSDEIEVVVNGPGLRKAYRKIHDAISMHSQNPFEPVIHQQKRAAAKARRKSRNASHHEISRASPRRW